LAGVLLPYHLRLALRGVRRHRGLSAAIVAGMALACAIWTAVASHYVRVYRARRALSPGLHQVELPHTTTVARAFSGSTAETSGWAARTRVSYPEYELLSGSSIPRRQAGSVRARLLVAPASGVARGAAADARLVAARMVSSDFFSMFEIPLGAGRAFSAAEEAAGEAVAVLGARLADTLFGRAQAVGATVLVEGRPFRVIGRVDGDQPFRPDWDIPAMGGNQDALYLPFAWFRRFLARPEIVLYQSPVGWRFEDLLASSAVYVAYWADLPTPADRAAYARYLDQRLGRRGVPYTLRSWAEWQQAFPVPDSTIRFFLLLGVMVLAGSSLNMARLLLARGSAHREELAIHRALGATRASLFVRQLVEALVLSAVATLAGVLLAVPYDALFNQLVADTDIPVKVTGTVLALAAGGTVLAGALAAVYPAWRLSGTPPAIHVGRR